MIVYFVLFAVLCLYQIKFSHFHSDYLGTSQTGSVKGIFAMIILFSHLRSYLVISTAADTLYCTILDLIGQLMVTLFFLYSGYGILESFRKKENYTKGFFRTRILKTLVHFDIAVLMFLILSLIIGQSYTTKDYILCWIGWTALGNSNWFVFDMLVLYAITLPALMLARRFRKKLLVSCVLTTILSLALWFVLRILRPGGWGTVWYNTILCYPLGMWLSLLKPWLDKHFLSKKRLSWLALAAVALGFVCCAVLYRMSGRTIIYSAYACAFSLLVVLMTSKVKIDNPILRWLGDISFAIYIFQRLPMILMQHLGISSHNFLFATLSILITLPLAWGFHKLYAVIDRKLFRKKA